MSVINRFCSSGLEATSILAAKIKAGIIDIGLAGGVENMTMFAENFTAPIKPDDLSSSVFENPQARDCLLGMGFTSENVAKQYGISREI